MALENKKQVKKLLFLGAVLFISLFFIKGELLADTNPSENLSLLSSSLSFSQDDYKKDDSLLMQDDNFKTGIETGVVTTINNPEVIETEELETSQQENTTEPDRRREAIKYIVKEGDVISTIAELFGLKTQTLLWANNLGERSIIKSGDSVTIPPQDGIMYKVKKGDTLGEIASIYEAEIDEIVEFNQLDSDKIVEGQELFLPNGRKPVYVAPTPKPKPRVVTSTPKVTYRSTSSSGCHSFPYGYCTWYVAQKRGCIPWGGNAGAWLANARAYGYSTGSEPVPGAIMVTRESWWGHVAYVESISGNSVTISEMNKHGWGRTNYRTLNKSSWVIRGYIYWR